MKVLLSVGGGIGNVIMATPAAAALGRLGFQVTMYLQPEAVCAAELLRGWDALRRVVTGPSPDPGRFDLAVHTVWSRRRGIHPDERSPGEVDLRNMHEAEANMIPVRALGYAGPLPPAHVEIGQRNDLPQRTQRTQRKPGDGERRESKPSVDSVSSVASRAVVPYWVLAPGCNPEPFWARKRWGGWGELAERLGGVSVLLGTRNDLPQRTQRRPGDGERRESKPSVDSVPSVASRAVLLDLTGRTTLAEAAGIVANCRCCIAVDNGISHVAAALGVPTVVLFGATSEVKNRPLGPRVRLMTRDIPCRPCQMTPRWDECTEWRCMDLSPELVAEAAFEASRS